MNEVTPGVLSNVTFDKFVLSNGKLKYTFPKYFPQEVNDANILKTIGKNAFLKYSPYTTINSYYSYLYLYFNKYYCEIIFDFSKIDLNQLKTIEEYAFSGFQKAFFKITIPDSVTTIGEGAFANCYEMKSVTLPNNTQFTTIQKKTFKLCSTLESITIPNSVTTIGDEAFANCSGLKSIIIPDSVTTIGDKAFENCKNLQITFSNNSQLETIGKNAFQNCVNLNSITIPDSVTKIEDYAFYNCGIYTTSKIFFVKFNILSKLETIGNFSFSNSSIKNIEIPNSVKKIGVGAFYGCIHLKTVELPKNTEFTTIQRKTFYQTGLIKINIPYNVLIVERGAFSDKYNTFSEIKIDNANTKIANNSFDIDDLTSFDTKLIIPTERLLRFFPKNIDPKNVVINNDNDIINPNQVNYMINNPYLNRFQTQKKINELLLNLDALDEFDLTNTDLIIQFLENYIPESINWDEIETGIKNLEINSNKQIDDIDWFIIKSYLNTIIEKYNNNIHSLDVVYNNINSQKLTTTQTSNEPFINKFSKKKGLFYTLIFYDADANYIHWIVNDTGTILDYKAPNPQDNKIHHYIYLLFQSKKLITNKINQRNISLNILYKIFDLSNQQIVDKVEFTVEKESTLGGKKKKKTNTKKRNKKKTKKSNTKKRNKKKNKEIKYIKTIKCL